MNRGWQGPGKLLCRASCSVVTKAVRQGRVREGLGVIPGNPEERPYKEAPDAARDEKRHAEKNGFITGTKSKFAQKRLSFRQDR